MSGFVDNGQPWLTYDDVLINPILSDVPSRFDDSVDPSVSLKGKLQLDVPVIPANMPCIATEELIRATWQSGSIGILDRVGKSPDEVWQLSQNLLRDDVQHGVSVGLSETEDQIKRYEDLPLVTLELARGDSQVALNRAGQIRRLLPDTLLMVGNIVSKETAVSLGYTGVDIVKVGVGPGAACTTRLVAGVGVPQLTAIMRVREALGRLNKAPMICADGGIKHAGDVGKAIIAGADFVMVGSMFSKCVESQGEYRGSSTYTDERVHEGVRFEAQKTANVVDLMRHFEGGLRSTMSYCSARTLTELYTIGKFIRVTSAGQVESGPRSG